MNKSTYFEKKLPPDDVLKSMKKTELIELLHLAQENYDALLDLYLNTHDKGKRNKCLMDNYWMWRF